MPEDIQAMRCPACGAPLQFEEEQSTVVCGHCGVQVQRDQAPKIEDVGTRITIDLEKYTSMAQTQVRSSAWVVVAVVAFIIFFVGIMAFSIVSSSEVSKELMPSQQIDANQVYSISSAQMLEASAPEMLVVAYVVDSTYRYVYLDFGAEKVERWRSAPLPDEYYRAISISDEQNIYVAMKTELYAISRKDGVEQWRVKLSDEISSACESCLMQAGDSVVVLPQDGLLAAYKVKDGVRAWGSNLVEPTRTLALLDGNPVVWDKGDNGAVLRMFDLATGQEVRQIAPSGPNEPFPNDPQTPDIYSPLILDGDGKSFYTFFGTFEPLSIQRWDAQSGTMLWQVTTLESFVQGSSSGQLLSEGHLFLSANGKLLAIETASGVQKEMESVENYEITPIVAQENKLLVSARRQRGSARDELWAYDLVSGKIAWKFVPEAKKWMADEFGFVDSDGEWMTHPVAGGILLIQFTNDPVGMSYQRLDLNSGVAGELKTMLPPGNDENTTTIYLNPFYWQGEKLWYAGDKLYLVDLDTGQQTIKWP